MALRHYEMLCKHKHMKALFCFKSDFDDTNKDEKELVMKMCKIADDYFKNLKEIGFELKVQSWDTVAEPTRKEEELTFRKWRV